MQTRALILAACAVLALAAIVLVWRGRKQAMDDPRRYTPLNAVLARPLRCGDAAMLVRPPSGAAATVDYMRALDKDIAAAGGDGAAALAVTAGKGGDVLIGVARRPPGLALMPRDGAVRVPVTLQCASAATAPAGAVVSSVDYQFGPE